MGPMDVKKKELLFSIHRHWIWADRLRQEYYERLKANPPTKDLDLVEWFLNADGMYMCLWYGLLFTVCEGLREGGFTVPNAQPEINAIYDSLRLFRNAIFHVQSEYWSLKLLQITRDPNSAAKIKKAHQTIGGWLLGEIRASAD